METTNDDHRNSDDTVQLTVKSEKGSETSFDVRPVSSTGSVEPVANSRMNSSKMADVIGGSQTRRYLNANVTPFLLAGMRIIATEQPEDPLRRLGEYLIEQSELQKRNGNEEQSG